MKIAKLTWLHNGNYGSVLQALALQEFLQKRGYNIIDINYKASIPTKLLNYIMNRNSPKLLIGKIKEFKRKKECKNPEKFILRYKRFEEFKNKNMNLTPLYKTPKELKKIKDDYDIFICGSDQIWSPALMNPIFYLSFVDRQKIKISYAPSFGVMNTTETKKRKIKKLLKNFKYISIREERGQAFISELLEENVPIVVDPTMLINMDEWNHYVCKEPLVKEKYIFLYLLTPNKIYIENVKKFAEKKGLKVVVVPTIKGPFETKFIEIPEAGPSEWLNLIKNSQYVFTDSFHGCIFAAIFHKEMVLYKRFSDRQKDSENSRIYTLTKFLDIEERLIDQSNLETIYEFKTIDFKNIDSIILKKANESGNWLINAIEKSVKGE